VFCPHTYLDSIFDKVERCNIGCNMKWFCLSIIVYGDDIFLLAPTVSSLQQLLHICEIELARLYMSINVKNRRVYVLALAIIVSDVIELLWTAKKLYMDEQSPVSCVYLVSSIMLSCNYDLIKSSFIVHLMRSMKRLEN